MTADPSETEVAGRPRRWPLPSRIDPLTLGAIVLAGCALIQLRTCAKLVGSDQSNLAGEEYNVVFATERFMTEGVLYADPAEPPFAITAYGPLYYLIGRLAIAAAGLRAGDALGITRALRSVSFAALLMQVATVAFLLRRHVAAPWKLVIAAGVSVLVWQTPWCLAARPDSTETLLVLAATGLFLEAVRDADRGRRATAWLAASLVCGTLAILAKQTGFVAGLIVLPPAVALLGWRRTAAACAIATVPAAALVAGLVLPFGPSPRANLIDWVKNGTAFRTAVQVAYAPYLRWMAAPLAGALVASWVLLRGWRDGPRGRAGAVIGWGALIVPAVATRVALNYGSAINYYNASNLFLALSVAAFLALSPQPPGSRRDAFVALYLVLFLPAKMYNDLNSSIAVSRPYGECAEVARRLRALLDAAPPGARFFSQDPRLDCLIPDRCLVPQKLGAAIVESRRPGYFAPFVRAVRDGVARYCITLDDYPVDLVDSFRHFQLENLGITDPDRPAFLGASFEGFRPLFRVGPHTIYAAPGVAEQGPQNGNRAGSSDSGRRSP